MNQEISINGVEYLRIPVRTKLILKDDDLLKALEDGFRNSGLNLQNGDLIFVSEKAVSASQGRYYLLDRGEIRPRRLAKFLSRFVTKTPAGIGLGMPETMECALWECGVIRILFAAFIGALGKLFGRKGDFYRIAGPKARSIDGPTNGTIPPFNRAVSLGPMNPESVAGKISDRFSTPAAIVDINDLGGNILGMSDNIFWNKDLLLQILSDNPLGQGCQQTPLGIIRKLIS